MLEMNEGHGHLFCQITGTPTKDELPENVVASYWRYKRCCDKASIRVTEQDIARICTECGYGDEPKAVEDMSVVDLWKNKMIEAEQAVFIMRGKVEKPGVLKRVTAAGEAIVVLDGEGEERHYTADKVKIAQVA